MASWRRPHTDEESTKYSPISLGPLSAFNGVGNSEDNITRLRPSDTRQSTRRRSLPRLHIICYLMHAFLIIIHIVLLIIRHFELERTVVRRSPQGIATLSITKTIMSQTFAIVYLAVLLYVTQRMALGSSLPKDDIKTLHDKQISWTGLGASMMTWFTQFSSPSSFSGVSAVMVYLLFTAGLKITTPAIFDVVPINRTTTALINVSLPNPDVVRTSFGGLDTSRNPIARSLEIAPFLNNEIGFPALGLDGNLLYSVLPLNDGTGKLMVDSYTVNVNCGYRPKDSRLEEVFEPSGSQLCSYAPGDQQCNATAPNTLTRVSLDIPNDQRSLFLSGWLASFKMKDSNDVFADRVQINPPMNPILQTTKVDDRLLSQDDITQFDLADVYKLNVSDVAILLCTTHVSYGRTAVDAQARMPVVPTQRKNSSSWNDTVAVNRPNDSEFEPIFTKLLELSDEIANTVGCEGFDEAGGFIGHYLEGKSNGAVTLPECIFSDRAESFIMNRIGVQPFIPDLAFISNDTKETVPLHNLTVPDRTIMLHDFEQAMESYVASMIWSVSFLGNQFTYKMVEVPKIESASQLRLILLPLIIGLIFSIGLLALTPAVALVNRKQDHRVVEKLDTLGVLEVLWLSKRDQRFHVARDAVAELESPSGWTLREAARRERSGDVIYVGKTPDGR